MRSSSACGRRRHGERPLFELAREVERGREREGRLAVEVGLPGERDVACLQLQVVEAVLAAIAGQAAAQLLEQWLAVVVRLPQAEAFDRHGQRQLQVGWQGSRCVARRLVDAQGRDVQGSHLQPAMQQLGG